MSSYSAIHFSISSSLACPSSIHSMPKLTLSGSPPSGPFEWPSQRIAFLRKVTLLVGDKFVEATGGPVGGGVGGLLVRHDDRVLVRRATECEPLLGYRLLAFRLFQFDDVPVAVRVRELIGKDAVIVSFVAEVPCKAARHRLCIASQGCSTPAYPNGVVLLGGQRGAHGETVPKQLTQVPSTAEKSRFSMPRTRHVPLRPFCCR